MLCSERPTLRHACLGRPRACRAPEAHARPACVRPKLWGQCYTACGVGYAGIPCRRCARLQAAPSDLPAKRPPRLRAPNEIAPCVRLCTTPPNMLLPESKLGTCNHEQTLAAGKAQTSNENGPMAVVGCVIIYGLLFATARQAAWVLPSHSCAGSLRPARAAAGRGADVHVHGHSAAHSMWGQRMH